MKTREEIIKFFEKEFDIILNDQSILFRDFHVDGEDGEWVMDMLQNQFGVDMSDFVFHKYFLDEEVLVNLFYHIFPKSIYKKIYGKEKLEQTIITFPLSHLIKVIEQGRWFDPD